MRARRGNPSNWATHPNQMISSKALVHVMDGWEPVGDPARLSFGDLSMHGLQTHSKFASPLYSNSAYYTVWHTSTNNDHSLVINDSCHATTQSRKHTIPRSHAITQSHNHTTTQLRNHAITQPHNHEITQSATKPSRNHAITQTRHHGFTQPRNHAIKHPDIQTINKQRNHATAQSRYQDNEASV